MEALPPSLWVHKLYSTLQGYVHTWYIHSETHHQTGNWKELATNLIQKFEYQSTNPSVDNALQVVKYLTMRDSSTEEVRLLELLGEPGLEVHFEEEVKEVEEI